MANIKPVRIKTISQYHALRGLPAPQHPLISVVSMEVEAKHLEDTSLVLDFYSVSLKRGLNGKLKYGQQEYDFDEGVMFFISPNQVTRYEEDKNNATEQSGWVLLIHPDFFWNTPLAKKIRKYEFFDYAINEALFLSEKEEKILNAIVENIRLEYYSNIDSFSQEIITGHLETLLSYCNRFYHRQFLTRKKANHQVLENLERLLADYFDNDDLISRGLPTVQFVSDQLNISVGYLSRLLKTLTGQNTQQHIHDKLIEKAKDKLSTTDLSVSEIAYTLGFEHSQSFSKLFKTKTKQSPLEFRQSFN